MEDQKWIALEKNATGLLRLAGKELRRYLYLLGEGWMEIGEGLPGKSSCIVVAVYGHDLWKQFHEIIGQVPEDGYVIRTDGAEGGRRIILCGREEISSLYAVYTLLEGMGMRFQLNGDIFPEDKPGQSVFEREWDIVQAPLFKIREILPFHDFPEGPDWWYQDNYRQTISQLVKLKGNFIGFHTYPEPFQPPRPEKAPCSCAEPLVWVGMPQDCTPQGDISIAYPAQHFKTNGDCWGYGCYDTQEYPFGTGNVFEGPVMEPEYMEGYEQMTYAGEYWDALEHAQEPSGKFIGIFESCSDFFGKVFSYAQENGVKTCAGTEVPLYVPSLLRNRYQLPEHMTEAQLTELYKGMFLRMKAKYPLDYYWLWTGENWTWNGNTLEESRQVLQNYQCALAAKEQVGAQFGLAACGWTLGPQEDRALYDRVLPKEIPFSCINSRVGFEPVDRAFERLEGRQSWAIPWMEDDGAMTSPQLWVGRLRKDAYDAVHYGCQGLIGIHWRTENTGVNIRALMEAAWHQEGWEGSVRQDMPTEGWCSASSEGIPTGLGTKCETDQPWPGLSAKYCSMARRDPGQYVINNPAGWYKVSLLLTAPFPGKTEDAIVQIQSRPVYAEDIKVAEDGLTGLICLDSVLVEQNGDLKIVFEAEETLLCAIVIEGLTDNNQLVGTKFYRVIDCGTAEDLPYYEGDFRCAESGDFYEHWAEAQFGHAAGRKAAEIFRKIDSRMPRPSYWEGGPGKLMPNSEKWEDVEPNYLFVEEFVALGILVPGGECRERYSYWLQQWLYLRASAKVGCLQEAFRRACGQEETEAIIRTADELREAVREMNRALLLSVRSMGDIGVLTDIQQRSVLPLMKECSDQMKSRELPCPDWAAPVVAPCSRIVLLTERSNIRRGEGWRVRVLVIGGAKHVFFRWHSLNHAEYYERELSHQGRWVYETELAGEEIRDDFGYSLRAEGDAASLCCPSAEDKWEKTVVVL